jgi:hypothetical protein
MTRQDIQKPLALIVGAVLAVLGLAGFFTGQAILWFGTNALQNVIHLATGILGLIAFWQGFAKTYNQWAGVFYLAVAVLGLIFAGFAGLLNANAASHVLHLVVGLILAGVGFFYKDAEQVRATA